MIALSKPFFSIITPTYNRAAVLRRAVESVASQTLTQFEHIIVDDGSTDDTEAYIASLNDPRVIYTKLHRHQGANHARNVGIRIAKSDWLTFLDSDDAYFPHRLERLAAICYSGDSTPVLLSSFQFQKRRKNIKASNPNAVLRGESMERALMAYGISVAGASITVQKAKAIEVGGFCEELSRLQDRDFLLRLARVSDVQTLERVDWQKYASADSISGQFDGYVEALANLLREHPGFEQKYRTLVGYHVARHFANQLAHGRIGALRRDSWVNRSRSELRFSLAELARCYYNGPQLRREWSVKQLAQRNPRRGITVADRSRFEPATIRS